VGVILDSSVLIGAERGSLRIEQLLLSLGGEPVAMAAITAAEMLHGCHRAVAAAVRARRWAFVEGLLSAITILPFGIAEARRHAELWAGLAQLGGLIGPHDMLVGATALAQGYSLATLNQREFSRIPGLRLVSTERFRP
jgi:predicted nucleic acid-binding protein